MRFSQFFWDFDGTLFDTYPRVTRAFQKGLRDLGVETPYDALFPMVKRSLAFAADTLASEHSLTRGQILDAYHVHAEDEDYDTMRPYPGAEDALRAVCACGGRNYLYTHRGLSGVKALEHYALDSLFADFVTSADGFPGKPAPDALLHLMRKHGLCADACVMVGDRDIDLEAGKNAGMAGALFDPDALYDAYQTQWRFRDMRALISCLIAEKV